jgi:MFS family permease
MLTQRALGPDGGAGRQQLPPFSALFRSGQLRWTAIGISSYLFAGTAFFLIAVLLPKALVDQGAAIRMSFGVASLVFAASIPGKAFTGYLMEVVGRRWTICYALLGSLPGLGLMLLAHHAGRHAAPMIMVGAAITGFTALSAATAFRIHLAEQFPTALRGRGHIFGESAGRIFSGVLAPFLMAPHTARRRSSSGRSSPSCRLAPSSRYCSAARRWGSSKPSPRACRSWPDRPIAAVRSGAPVITVGHHQPWGVPPSPIAGLIAQAGTR